MSSVALSQLVTVLSVDTGVSRLSKSSVVQSLSKPAVTPSSFQSANKALSSSRHAPALTTSTQHRPSSAQHVLSTDDEDSESSVDIGKSGSKFIKKRVESVPTVQDSRPAAVEKPRQWSCLVSLSVFVSQ